MVSKIRFVAATLTFALPLSFFGGHAMAAGALAINGNQGDQYGFVHGYPNISQAEQKAMSECGSGCRVALQFNSGCGAYAADQSGESTVYGWGTGSSSSAAQNRALSECQSKGGPNCIVRSYACD
jgi:hypothetical protein